MGRKVNRFGSVLQTNWDWRAAGNFIFGGTGSGLLVTAAFAGPSIAISVLAAMALICAGLALVWLEIGRPWRGFNVFAHPQTSWMTREASAAVVTLALAVAGLVFEDSRMIAGAGAGALAFLYCQGRIIQAAKGIPAWREPAIVPLVVVTGLAEGASLYLVLLALSGLSAAWIGYALVALLVLRAIAWQRYRGRLAASGAPEQVTETLRRINAAFLGAGNLLPAVLLLMALVIPSASAASAVAGGILAIWGGWHQKFHLITRAAQVQGYAIGKLRRGHPKAGYRAARS